ncbi:hypothetical protein [Rhodanobacter lindaniclasticus]
MRKVSSLLLPLCLVSVAALAQSAPPAASDQWQQPATSASVAAHAATPLPGGDAAAKPSPFKFKGERKAWTDEPPPPQANDKAAVMGKQRPWQNGRPPLDCAARPRDPACR